MASRTFGRNFVSKDRVMAANEKHPKDRKPAGNRQVGKGKPNSTPDDDSVFVVKESTIGYTSLRAQGVGILNLLEIKPVPKYEALNTAEMLIALVRQGITKRGYEKMLKATELSATELADLIDISDRTLRRYTPEQTLSKSQSERMVELASLYSRGSEVFQSLERFNAWIGRPQVAFGNKAPKNYLDTSMGIGIIMDELGRIEHGIFA